MLPYTKIDDLYQPVGKSLKDNWFYVQKDIVHMFHMQRNLEVADSQRASTPAEIGHAVSKDLIHWDEMQTALVPSREGSLEAMFLDDFTLATGNTILNENIGEVNGKKMKYQMFYTQRPFKKNTKQHIATAFSDDLMTWEKYLHNPILSADLEHYDMGTEKDRLLIVHAFRDPFVFEADNNMYMAFTARDLKRKNRMTNKDNPFNSVYNGCIGLAVLAPRDQGLMTEWTWLPPLLSPGEHVEMEVPQIVKKGDNHYLFFSTWKKGNRYRYPGGLYCYMSDDGPLGHYKPLKFNTLVMNYDDMLHFYGYTMYGVKIIDTGEERDEYPAVGWVDLASDEPGNVQKTHEIKRVSPPITIRISGNEVRWDEKYTPLR